MTPERFDWLEELAFNGAELPGGLRFPDQLLFLRLRLLYAYAKIIHMDPEQGRREKHEILREHQTHNAEYALLCSVNDRNRNVEAAAIEIRRDAALYGDSKVRALMAALYGDVDRKEFT